jgi:GNAT superfamily N-acetyltransferase
MHALDSTFDEGRIVDLIVSQQRRWSRIDSRLPQIPTSELPSFLKQGYESCKHPPVVVGPAASPDCMAFPGFRSLDPESDELVYFQRLTGTAIQASFRSTSPRVLDRVIGTLLARLEETWKAGGATAAIFNWPSRDGDVHDLFHREGYTLDSHIAVRSGVSHREPSCGSDGTVTTRRAISSDEAAILDLHRQVIQAHIPNAPFARLHPAAIPAMRDRLRRMWAGETVEEGASLVIVAELDDRVVAMAECQIRSISAEPGALLQPGRYLLINSFGVSQAVRRRGIGNILERAVTETCANLSVDGSYLIFSPYNPSANSFWPSVGYEPIWTLYQKRGLRALAHATEASRNTNSQKAIKSRTIPASLASLGPAVHSVQ